MMNRIEAYTVMQRYVSSVGGTGVERWSDKDAEIMRECLDVLMYGVEDEDDRR